MHELPIMENVLAIVLEFAQQNAAKSVCQINLCIGALSDIIPHWAQLYFAAVAKGTIAEGATLAIDRIPARVRCRSCEGETELDPDHMEFVCSHCGSSRLELLSGREFMIHSIEIT